MPTTHTTRSDPPKPEPLKEVALNLAEIGELFDAPIPDPFTGQMESRTGMGRLKEKLSVLSNQDAARLGLVLRLPPAEAGPECAEVAGNAIRVWCDMEEMHLRDMVAALRRERNRALLVGGIFLFLCLATAAFIERLPGLPEMLRTLLVEGAIIAGWVGLWHPLELALYGWWPIRHDRRIVSLIRGMPLRLEAT